MRFPRKCFSQELQSMCVDEWAALTFPTPSDLVCQTIYSVQGNTRMHKHSTELSINAIRCN